MDLAKAMGATHTVSIEEFPDPADRRAAVLAATGGRAPSVAFEMSGGRTAFAEGLELLARGGRYVLMGQVAGWSTPSAPAGSP